MWSLTDSQYDNLKSIVISKMIDFSLMGRDFRCGAGVRGHWRTLENMIEK